MEDEIENVEDGDDDDDDDDGESFRLEEEFPVPKTTAASKIGNGVISLL